MAGHFTRWSTIDWCQLGGYKICCSWSLGVDSPHRPMFQQEQEDLRLRKQVVECFALRGRHVLTVAWTFSKTIVHCSNYQHCLIFLVLRYNATGYPINQSLANQSMNLNPPSNQPRSRTISLTRHGKRLSMSQTWRHMNSDSQIYTHDQGIWSESG